MNIYFEPPKATKHRNPPLVAGRVYQELGSSNVYLAVMIPIKDTNGNNLPCYYLVSVETGIRFSDYGFNGVDFIDITDHCKLSVGS